MCRIVFLIHIIVKKNNASLGGKDEKDQGPKRNIRQEFIVDAEVAFAAFAFLFNIPSLAVR